MKAIQYQKWIPFFIITFLFSCNNKAEENYDLAIPKDDLIGILVDLTVAESAVTNFDVKVRDSVKNVYRIYIEKLYDIPIVTIDSTLNVLYTKPLLNQEIQKAVSDTLKSLESQYKLK